MTTGQGQPPPAGAPAPEPAGQPPAGGTLDDRVGSLERGQGEIRTEQTAQRGTLDKILAAVTGPGAAPGGGQGSGQGGPPGDGGAAPDIASQVRAEIERTQQRQAAEARAKGDADWRANVDTTLEQLKGEKTPREPDQGLRGKVQRFLIGRPG